MDMEDVDDLMTYWADHPPVHLMVAAYLGVKPKTQGPPQKPGKAEIDQLVQMFGRG